MWARIEANLRVVLGIYDMSQAPQCPSYMKHYASVDVIYITVSRAEISAWWCFWAVRSDSVLSVMRRRSVVVVIMSTLICCAYEHSRWSCVLLSGHLQFEWEVFPDAYNDRTDSLLYTAATAKNMYVCLYPNWFQCRTHENTCQISSQSASLSNKSASDFGARAWSILTDINVRSRRQTHRFLYWDYIFISSTKSTGATCQWKLNYLRINEN